MAQQMVVAGKTVPQQPSSQNPPPPREASIKKSRLQYLHGQTVIDDAFYKIGFCRHGFRTYEQRYKKAKLGA